MTTVTGHKPNTQPFSRNIWSRSNKRTTADCLTPEIQRPQYRETLHAQGLGLSPITCQPRDVIMSFIEPSSGLDFDGNETPEANERMYEDCNVYEEEQAEIYSSWAQSILLSFRLGHPINLQIFSMAAE